MKFTYAWSEIANQNILLKFSLGCLTFTTTILLIVVVQLSLEAPLVIERGYTTRIASSSQQEYTDTEIKNFLKEALESRFDTDVGPNESLLSIEEAKKRDIEQRELKTKEMKQRIIVNNDSIKLQDGQATIELERLIVVAGIRSAFSFPVSVNYASIRRTESNPYGLKLTQVKPHDQEKKKQ